MLIITSSKAQWWKEIRKYVESVYGFSPETVGMIVYEVDQYEKQDTHNAVLKELNRIAPNSHLDPKIIKLVDFFMDYKPRREGRGFNELAS